MNKKRAKFNFVLTSILLVIALVLCFAQFKLPQLNTNFNGLFNSIQATNDITSGQSAVYEITSNASDQDVEETLALIRVILANQGIDNANVYRQGDFIRAEVQETEISADVLSIIGDPQSFFISSTDKETLTEEELGEYDLVGTDVKNAYATTQTQLNKTYNGITIEFTNSGAKKYQDLTEQVAETEAKTIYFYIGGNKQNGLEIEGKSTQNYLSFYYESSSGSSGVSYEQVQAYALQILMASTGVELELVSSATSSPMLNNALLFALITFAAALFVVLVLMPFLYGSFGFVADLSILTGVVLNVFLLQALPFTTSSIAGIVGSMIGMGLLVLCHVIYLNKMKSEFRSLKRMQLAAKTGFKKTWLKNLDITTISFIGGVVLGLWGLPYLSTFGIGLAIGAFVALFNTVVVFKDFVTWYLCINSKNYKRVKFTKEEGNE